ncbi:MAG: hypothetical protein M0Z38_13155 [Deltaproteobacteria bacterium]|nr:hypothetical protein [Deltaproteobacteria bacterium]
MSAVACLCVPDDAFPYAEPVDVCNCCRRRFYRFEQVYPHVIGVQRDLQDEPRLVLYICPRCGSTQAVLWAEASSEMQDVAENVELLAAMIVAETPAVGPEA